MSKYEVGDKATIEILGKSMTEYIVEDYTRKMIYFDTKSLDGISEPLSTYTEPLEAEIRRQAAEITRLLAENERLKPNYENIRAKGQNEAWELARKIVLMEKEGGMKDEDYKAIFGGCQPSDYILKTHTYPEAAAKVAEWERAKEEICVGDVVRFKENNSIEFCVTQIDCDGYLYGVWRNGLTYSGRNPELWEKTGRHIDIDSFLKQIGEE